MIIKEIEERFVFDLEKLKDEISSYDDEKNIWKTTGDINNSPGNLCLHICGNLQHFVGTVLGKTGYVRNRELEFSQKNVSKEGLLAETDITIAMIKKAIRKKQKENS